MLKKHKVGILLFTVVLTLVFAVLSVEQSSAQVSSRAITPSPRMTIEAIDPATGMSRSYFCTGANTIDVKITNNSSFAQFVSIINRDTRGVERTLYNGQLQTGVSYLSRLLGTQLSLAGPAGTETLRLQSNDSQWQGTPSQVTYSVQVCASPAPAPGPAPGPSPGPSPWPPSSWFPGPSNVQIFAQVQPYAIEQGKKGTITLQAGIGHQQNCVYFFEILNSWGQLWRRIPVTKQPFAPYQVKLPVGKKTKPGVLTYTVNLLAQPGYGGEQKIGSTRVSFRVVTAGSIPGPYNPGYPGGYPSYPSYPTHPGYVPMPYGNAQGYGVPQPYEAPMYSPYSAYGYGVRSMGSSTGERSIP